MLFKKCTGCKREFTKKEIEKIKLTLKSQKKPLKDLTCPDCHKHLKTYDQEQFQKKWYGYLSDDKKIIEHLILVEFKYYDDDSFEITVPLLNFVLETKDFSEAINIPDKQICLYLKNNYQKIYSNEHKFLTIAFPKEITTEKKNVEVWWKQT